MGLIDWLTPKPEGSHGGFVPAAEFAGFFVAQAVTALSRAEPLVPLLAHEGPGGRGVLHFAAPKMQDGIDKGQAWMAANPLGARHAAFIHDGFMTVQGAKRDVVVCRAAAFGPPRRAMTIVVPYRPAAAGAKFAIHRPKFGSGESVEDDAALVGEAFFRGIARHQEANAVWQRHLDESI